MFLGIDVSARDVATVLARLDGATILALRTTLPPNCDAPQAWKIAIDTAQETLLRSQIERSQMRGVALALDAKINANGVVERNALAEGWHNFDLANALRQTLKIDNARAASRVFCEFLGEERFGAWRNSHVANVSSLESANPNIASATNANIEIMSVSENAHAANANFSDSQTQNANFSTANASNSQVQNANVANANFSSANANTARTAESVTQTKHDFADANSAVANANTAKTNTNAAGENVANVNSSSVNANNSQTQNSVANASAEKTAANSTNSRAENARIATKLYLRVGERLSAVVSSISSTRNAAESGENSSPIREMNWGEICIERDGILSGSGRRGALEAYCGSEDFLVRAAGYGMTLQSAAEIWAQASGSFAAQSLCDDYVRRLAQGVGAAISLLQPTDLLLGGALCDALGETLLQPLRAALPEFCDVPPNLNFAQSQLAHDGAVLGAVALAMQTQS